jgi:hypothetical protein
VVAKEAEALLARLKNWGATSGIPDLNKAAVVDTLQKKGMAIWKETWERRKQQVEAAIASVNYKGVGLAYRGSLAKGAGTWYLPTAAEIQAESSTEASRMMEGEDPGPPDDWSVQG